MSQWTGKDPRAAIPGAFVEPFTEGTGGSWWSRTNSKQIRRSVPEPHTFQTTFEVETASVSPERGSPGRQRLRVALAGAGLPWDPPRLAGLPHE